MDPPQVLHRAARPAQSRTRLRDIIVGTNGQRDGLPSAAHNVLTARHASRTAINVRIVDH